MARSSPLPPCPGGRPDQVGLLSLIIVLAGGFILVGRVRRGRSLETSRRLEKGEPVSLARSLRAGFYGGGQLAHMGLLLMLIYLAWVEIALLLFMLFLGPQPMPPLGALFRTYCSRRGDWVS